MSERRGLARSVFSVLLLAATVAGLYNVYADNSEVLASAKAVACGTTARCDPTMTSMQRTPLGQTYAFSLGANLGSVSISCQRAFVLLGEYRCARQ